jgi:hypothetical protein
VNGRVPADVVAVVEPGPLPPLVLAPTDSQDLLLYAWQDDELARAIAGAINMSTPRSPTRAENRFMNPFVRRGIPKKFVNRT